MLKQPPMRPGTNDPDIEAPLKNYTLRESFATAEESSARAVQLSQNRRTAFQGLSADAQDKLAAWLTCGPANGDPAALEKPLALYPEDFPRSMDVPQQHPKPLMPPQPPPPCTDPNPENC